MSDEQMIHDQITQFEQQYDYDAEWMHDLLNRTSAGFAVFDAARPMTVYHAELPADAHYVAAMTVMQTEDCGPCLELNFKLAQEAGVERTTLLTLMQNPTHLPGPLNDVYRHTKSVLKGESPDKACAKRIEAHYGPAAFAELALCIVGVRMYPVLKRALLHADHCAVGAITI